jgi:hypothetical protein
VIASKPEEVGLDGWPNGLQQIEGRACPPGEVPVGEAQARIAANREKREAAFDLGECGFMAVESPAVGSPRLAEGGGLENR